MMSRSFRWLILGPWILLLCQCAWFQPEPPVEPIIKPVPIGGYEVLATRIHYPKAAREEGVEGSIEVRAQITREGQVANTNIVASLHPELDRIVVNAVKRTRFEPATRAGEPLDIWIAIPFVFALNDWQDRPSPFDDFEMVIHPDPAYESFHVEMKAHVDNLPGGPLRLECLLPVNHENPWVKTAQGVSPSSGLVQDDLGEWLVFEASPGWITFGFQYRPFMEQSGSKLQYGFTLNQSLPEWTLSVVYDDQTIIFNQEPDRAEEQADGSKRFEYDLPAMEAYETRYLELGLEK